MLRRGSAGIVTLLLALAPLALVASPARAAGETFEVLSVNTTGCTSGAFGMTVERAGLDGGNYVVRTQVTVDGLSYMNESATISVNGNSSWNVFDTFTYGAVPNQGTYPIPQNKQMRLQFTLERPTGTILYDWTLVVDGCNSGNVLFNGLTASDADLDLVATPQDKCGTLPAATTNGCPLRARSLTMGRTADRLTGWLFAEGFPKFHARKKVTIWKVRPGPDQLVTKVTTNKQGAFTMAAKPKRGRYYATAPGLILPLFGEVTADRSMTVKVRR